MSNRRTDNDRPKPECSEPHDRRKRRRTGESVVLRHQIRINPANRGLRLGIQSLNKGSNPVGLQHQICTKPANPGLRHQTQSSNPGLNPVGLQQQIRTNPTNSGLQHETRSPNQGSNPVGLQHQICTNPANLDLQHETRSRSNPVGLQHQISTNLANLGLQHGTQSSNQPSNHEGLQQQICTNPANLGLQHPTQTPNQGSNPVGLQNQVCTSPDSGLQHETHSPKQGSNPAGLQHQVYTNPANSGLQHETQSPNQGSNPMGSQHQICTNPVNIGHQNETQSPNQGSNPVALQHQICTNPANLGLRHGTQSPNQGSNPVDLQHQICTNPANLDLRQETQSPNQGLNPVGLQHQICTNPANLGLRHETQSPNQGSDPVDISGNCRIRGYGQDNILPKLQLEESSNMVNNDQNRRQINCRRDSGEDETKKFDHFFTELDDALSRIESLIPSLQQKACSNEPTNHGSRVGASTLVNDSKLNPRHHLLDMLERFEECTCSRDCKQINEMLRKFNNLVPLPERDGIKLSNMIASRTIVDQPLNCVSTQSKLRASLFSNLESEKNLLDWRNQIREANNRIGVDRVEPVQYTLCRNDSVRSQVPDHIQGLQIMPCFFKNEDMNQNRMMYKESNVKHAVLRPQGRDPFIGSVNYARPERVSSFCRSDYKQSQCLTRGSVSSETSRSSERISFRDRDNRSKKNMMLSDSYSSSSETYQSTSNGSDGSYESEVQSRGRDWSPRRKEIEASDSTSGYDTSYHKSQDSYSPVVSPSQSRPSRSQDHDLNRNKRGGRFTRFKKKLGMIFHHHHHHHHYHKKNESDVGHHKRNESDVGHRKRNESDVGHRKKNESDVGHRKRNESDVTHRKGNESDVGHRKGNESDAAHHKRNESDVGHHKRNKSDVGHGGSFLKHVGSMFHQKGKGDGEKPKGDKPKGDKFKSVIKSVPNQKQGHHSGLVHTLMKHMKHSKKSKKAKDNFAGLGNSQDNKRKLNKLPGLPKINKKKGGLKVNNKGKLKLKNRKAGFSLTAAKMILKKR